MTQEIFNQTFHCERFNCNLLPERCIQRQIGVMPGCDECKQGEEIARKVGKKVGLRSTKRLSAWRNFGHRKKKVFLPRKYSASQNSL